MSRLSVFIKLKPEAILQWKKIRDWENYSVSNYGEVRNDFTHHVKSIRHHNGYAKTDLKMNGKKKTIDIHRIVAETFLPNPSNLPFVDHINRIKADNRAVNLRWVTRCQNSQNTDKHKAKTSSRYKNVFPIGRKWKAQCQMNKQSFHLGVFSTEEEARSALDEFVRAKNEALHLIS
jgi:hypothetical protein